MSIKWNKFNDGRYPWPEKKYNDGRRELWSRFMKDFGIEYIAKNYHIGKMGRCLDGDRSYNNTGKEIVFDNPPYRDHDRVFKGGIGRFYVYHPYEIDLDELEEWCNKRDIIFCFCDVDKSFYYPGHTYMVILMSDVTWELATYYGIIRRYEYQGMERKFRYGGQRL